MKAIPCHGTNHQLSSDSPGWVHSEPPPCANEAVGKFLRAGSWSPKALWQFGTLPEEVDQCFSLQTAFLGFVKQSGKHTEAQWDRTQTLEGSQSLWKWSFSTIGTPFWAMSLESLLEETQTLKVKGGKRGTQRENHLQDNHQDSRLSSQLTILWIEHYG